MTSESALDARARPPGRARLRVAVDATPLLGHRTGVGVFCAGLLGGLARRRELDLSAFAVSWRRRHGIEADLPPGVAVRQRAMPARPLQVAWRRIDGPPAEWFTGPTAVVHGTNFVVPPTRRAAAVVTVHDLTTVRFPELCDAATLAYPDLVRRAVRRGAWVHTPSEFVAGEVIEAFAVDPDRVRAVHSGTPPAAGPAGPTGPTGAPSPVLPAAVAALLPPGTGRYVLAVGTAEPRKDLPGLVRAFDEVAAERREVALVLAGPPGWGEEALAGVVDGSAHRARIVRSGWVDDAMLSLLLGSATVLAYPSVYEGFGFPPLQAMAVGTPVVATRAGALPEVLGQAALLVAPGDPAALSGALGRVLDSDDLRAALRERGRRRAAEFTWDACAAGLAGLYADAAAAAGTGGR